MTNVLELSAGTFRLPSLAIPYADKAKFVTEDSVRVIPIPAAAIRRMAGAKDPYQTYYAILSTCMIEPKTNLDKLTIDDALAILFAIKITSSGPIYPASFTCKHCKQVSEVKVILPEVECKYAYEVEGFKADGIEVEYDGHKFEIHLPKLGDEKLIPARVESIRKVPGLASENAEVDAQYCRIAQYVDKIDGKEFIDKLGESKAFIEKFKLLDTMHRKTHGEISKAINEHSIGLQTMKTLNCMVEECGLENEVLLVMSPDLFLSESSDS